MLFVQPESFVRVDQNTTITLNQTTDEIEVQFFAAELAVELRNTPVLGRRLFHHSLSEEIQGNDAAHERGRRGH